MDFQLSVICRGVISEARPVLEQLRLSGMYLSERLMNQVLMSVGE